MWTSDTAREKGFPSDRSVDNRDRSAVDVLLQLADRCEREEPGRILDWVIHDTILKQIGTGAYGNHPAYSTSVDAAIKLVPEGVWDVTSTGCAWWMPEAVSSDINIATGKTPALALCAAALKARAAVAERQAGRDVPEPDSRGG